MWLYGVTDDVAAPLTGELIGVGASVVRLLPTAGLVAVVADVEQEEFGEIALRQNLEDLGWLEQTARAHHAVIEAVAKRHPVVPMRLATVYNSDASVAEMLRDRAADFRDALSRIAECGEWGVKAFAVPPGDQGAAAGTAADGQDGSATGPGAAYLRRRRAQLTARTDARREAMASARDVYERLCRLAVSARLYPPQAPDLTGQPAPMVLNAAYLVADRQADAFAAALNELRGEYPSLQFMLTGPWPAYSFVAASESEDRQ